MAMFDKKNKHLEEDHHYKPQVPIEEQEIIGGTGSGDTANIVVEDGSVVSVEEIVEEPAAPVTISPPKKDWKSIESAPHNGLPAIISENGEDEGTVAFWRRTRAFLAKRWQDTGHWCDNATGLKVDFIPQYWKERF